MQILQFTNPFFPFFISPCEMLRTILIKLLALFHVECNESVYKYFLTSL